MSNSVLMAVGKALVSLAVIFIPVVATWATNLLKKHISSAQQLNLIETVAKFAQDAVVLAEKDGVLQHLTGSEQFTKAVSYVQDMLKSLGINDVDLALIQGAVEKAYAQAKGILNSVYGTPSLETPVTPQASKDSAGSVDKTGDNTPAQ